MNKTLINYYIALPMAITIFRQDRKTFGSFKSSKIFEDKLDATITQMKKDFYTLKKDIISKHHLDIRCVDQCIYSVNGQIIQYTPDELKEMTIKLAQRYFCGDKMVDFELQDRIWKDVVHKE